VSFGVTSYIRQGLGYDSVVDYSGGAYTVGQVDGTVNSFLLGYGAAGRVPQTRIWAYRAAQEYTVAGSVYGVGHSSYVLATDPQNFGFGDALGFLPLGGYVTSVARFGRTAGRVTVGSTGENILPAETVRQIGRGERVNNLIHEVAELTYTSGGREHAIISLPDGRRLIVRGGEGGMTFPDGLRRVILHTHPRPTGPSPLDFQMLELTGQRSSWIYELFGGGLTKFGR